MIVERPKWLSKKERIVLGAFYTPKDIVVLVRSLVEEYLRKKSDKVVVLDPAGGCGAFIVAFADVEYRVGDIDSVAIDFLKKHFNEDKIFKVDVLGGISRSSYNISQDAFLIVVGNPPYNDWTSLYKKGQKGFFKMSSEVFDRDLGIAFLKAITKLSPGAISILHPLSYLIKKTNFERLKNFFSNYRLKKGFVFPSFRFKNTSKNTAFPILVSLYEKGRMTYEDVLEFEFEVLDSEKRFKLSNYKTIDRLINKYPVKKSSSLGLYFHTFRDLNSLLRNKDFLEKPTELTIPIEPENLPEYCYLVCVKYFIKEKGAKNFWLFGNLSPLIDLGFFQAYRSAFVWFAYRRSRDFQRNISSEILKNLYTETFKDEILWRYLEDLYNVKD